MSNTSPTNTDPKFVSGSADILTTIRGYCGRRPGFADNVETTPTTFVNLVRLWTFDRSDGTFFVLANDIASSHSLVYKMQVGTDNSFVLIYTDTGSTNPFDFAFSNGTLYFSNGNVAKKWTPAQGVTNWGITAPSVTPTVSGTGSWWQPSKALATKWTAIRDANNNVQALTTTGTTGSVAPQWSSSIGATTTDNTAIWTCGGVPTAWKPSTYYQGSATVLDNNGNLQMATTVATTSASGANIPTWATSVGSTTSDGTITWTCLGTGSTVSFIGWQWVYCYHNSNSGHVSSPSSPSYSTGPILSASGISFSVAVTASTDTQVTGIKVFRSTDSVAPGATAGTYFEIAGSPFANTTGNVTDTTIDQNLSVVSFAPIPTFNDPPTPGKNASYFAGRVYMFNGNKQVFSALEECLNGVPEESFPSGVAGNFWNYDQPIQAQNVAGDNPNQTLGTFCGGRLYGITGNSLDTFRRFLVSNKRGCRSITCTAAIGGMVAWLDSANQIWITDGNSLNEIGIDIRPDIQGVTPSSCSMTFHSAGQYHWLVFSTGSQIFVYDLDMDQWMPPWSFACKYIYSGEISAGNYVLMASTGTKAVQLNTAKFNDQGVTYSPVIQTNLFAVVPDFGKRFSTIGTGTYDEPSRTGLAWYWHLDSTSDSMFTDVGMVTDDDPATSNYTSIFGNKASPEVVYERKNGTNLVQNVWPMGQQVSRWISFKVTLQNRDQADNIYTWFVAYAEKR